MKLRFDYQVLANDALFALGTLAVLAVLVGAAQFGRMHATGLLPYAADGQSVAGAPPTLEKYEKGTITSIGEFVPTAATPHRRPVP